MSSRDFAIQLARHYFRALAKYAGMPWDRVDNDAEIEQLVEAIIEAAKEEIMEEIRPGRVIRYDDAESRP